jgi:hypothetical protein
VKKHIVKIEQLAYLLFAKNIYNKFINNIKNEKLTAARIMIDIEIKKNDLDRQPDYNFKSNIAEKLQDFVMDLEINKYDERKESKQVEPNTG